MKFFASLLLCFFALMTLEAQYTFECGGPDNNPNANFNTNFSFDGFFQHDPCGTPLYINCRFVFLTRNDLTGSFDLNNTDDITFIDDVIGKMNQRWSNITDADNCLPQENYPKDANIRVKVVKDWYTANDAWDYTIQAAALNNYASTSFCPNGVLSNTNSTNLPLKQVIQDYNLQYPNTFNFFFVEDGDHVEDLEGHIANKTFPSGPWIEQFPIFGGCSMLASFYNDDRDQSIIMANWYSEYLARKEFGEIYYGTNNNGGNAAYVGFLANDFAITANHELGHSILDQFHTNSCDNLMLGPYDPGKRHLNLEQVDNLYGTLMATNNHKFVDCSELTNSTCKVEINNNITIDSPISVFGDLIVKEGVTLTLTSDVYLAEDSSIDVEENAKLIIDGALLTSDCDATWKGIRVAGGNTDFDVKIINSTIENTSRAAVDTEAWWYGNPNGATFGNGIVQIDNSTFNNTSRIVSFNVPVVTVNSSYIRNSTQNGGKYAITNYQNLFIDIENNIFNDITEECIVGIRGAFIITDNEFHGTDNDILLETSAAGFGSLITNNDFYGTGVGIRCVGTTSGQQNIESNNFYNESYALWMDGDNNYSVEDNFINTPSGGVFIATGNSGNNVYDNEINVTNTGLYIRGSNNDYNFYKNCFNSGGTDVYIRQGGSVGPIIANPASTLSRAANNCFTHGGTTSSTIDDINGSPLPFTYIVPNDAVVNCSDLLFAPPVVNTQNDGPSESACDEKTENNNKYIYPDFTIESNLLSKSWLEEQIAGANLENSAIYQNRLKNVIGTLGELYLRDGEYDQYNSLYENDDSWDSQLMLYSGYLIQHNFILAREWLSQLSEEDPEYIQNFKYVQEIYFREMEEGPEFEPTENQLDSLLTLSGNVHPYAAYAKAEYYALTGIILSTEIDINESGFASTGILGGNSPINEGVFKVYPNPFRNQLKISVPKDVTESSTISVYDLFGRNIISTQVSGKTHSYSTINWKPGTYILIVRNKSSVLHTEKIVLIK